MADIVSATDNTVTPGANAPQVADPTSVPVATNTAITSPTRVQKQKTLPSFITSRSLGQVITSSATGLGNALFANFVVPNSTSGVFTLKVANVNKQVILAVPDVSVYIGSQPSDATQWPTAAVGGGNLPVYVMNDFGQTDNVNVVTRVVVRNNTGSDQSITVAIRWRIITNSASALPNQSLFS